MPDRTGFPNEQVKLNHSEDPYQRYYDSTFIRSRLHFRSLQLPLSSMWLLRSSSLSTVTHPEERWKPTITFIFMSSSKFCALVVPSDPFTYITGILISVPLALIIPNKIGDWFWFSILPNIILLSALPHQIWRRIFRTYRSPPSGLIDVQSHMR